MSGLFIERVWPYVFAAVMTILWWRISSATFPTNAGPLLGATGTVSAVLVGFLVTAKAIVLGLTGSAVFKTLVSSGYNKVLFSYLFEAELGGIFLLVVSMVGFFVADPIGSVPFVYQILWIVGAFAALGTFTRVIVLLFGFLRRV